MHTIGTSLAAIHRDIYSVKGDVSCNNWRTINRQNIIRHKVAPLAFTSMKNTNFKYCDKSSINLELQTVRSQ